ncbi:MAG: hypothetical protein COA67_06315 [Lutibacter sp.]|nr:MAG: hypothetical protein COA67_06315 [Lutibacter sp.]
MIKNISILTLVLFFTQSFAQKTSASPYSVLGIGDDVSSKTVEEMSMGGVGTATNSTYQFTFSNPASYSSILLTTYSLAGQNRGISLKDASGKQKTSNASLSYLAMGIPLGEKGGFVFGLQPNTSVGYSLIDRVLDSNDEVLEITGYNGDGGTNRVFLGAGYEVVNNLSLGLEGEYVFGNINNSITNQKKDVQLGTRYITDTRIKGFGLKAGLLYKKELKDNLFLNLGATVQLENELDSKGHEYLYTVSFANGDSPRDTILNNASTGFYKKPLKTSFGVSIGNPKKWEASVDYSFHDKIELGGNLLNNSPKLAYQKGSKFSAGGYFLPKHNSISSYWDRVIYRAGVRVEQTGLMVNGTGGSGQFDAIDDFGISFGVGLPMGNQVSRLNLGFEFGKRGTTDNGLIEENYFNFKLGLSLSNKWFRKREIN